MLHVCDKVSTHDISMLIDAYICCVNYWRSRRGDEGEESKMCDSVHGAQASITT